MAKALITTVLFCQVFWVSGCSNDDDPVSSSWMGFELRAAYYYMYDDEEIWLETSRELLAVRFYDWVKESTREKILERHSLGVVWGPDSNVYSLYRVQTEDAFAKAPRLWQEGHIEYVGPVLISFECQGVPRHVTPGNQIIVNGDVESEQVAELLDSANARFVRELPTGSYLYELPWGDAGVLYDLSNDLHRHPAIGFCEPNELHEVCF